MTVKLLFRLVIHIRNSELISGSGPSITGPSSLKFSTVFNNHSEHQIPISTCNVYEKKTWISHIPNSTNLIVIIPSIIFS